MRADFSPREDARPFLSESKPPIHQATITSDEAFRLYVETHGGAMLDFLRQLRQRKIFVHSVSLEVLVRMLEVLDEDHLRRDRLIAKLSQTYLCEATGRKPGHGTRGHISRAIKELIRAGIITCIKTGTSISASIYELHLPKEATSRVNPFPVKRKSPDENDSDKKDCCAGAGNERAPVRVTNKTLARACACNQRAPVLTTNKTLARAREGKPYPHGRALLTRTGALDASDTTDISSSSSSAEEEERGDDAAAATSVLAEFGFDPESVLQILGLPTASFLVIRAACEEAANKPLGKRLGLARALIKDPRRISPHILDGVRKEIEDAKVKPFEGMVEPAKVAEQSGNMAESFRSCNPPDPREERRQRRRELEALPAERLAALIDRLIDQANPAQRKYFCDHRFVALDFAPMVDALHELLHRDPAGLADPEAVGEGPSTGSGQGGA